MSDKELVKKVANGDRSAIEAFISNYSKLITHMVARLIDDDLDREELAQDIFIKIFEKIGGFRFQSKLSTWVATIAYRQAINFLKKSKRFSDADSLDDLTIEIGEEDNRFEYEDRSKFIQQAIMALPHQYRLILTLYHLEEMSYPEIVEITKMPEGTVKNYLFRARKKLKELLEPHAEKELLV